MMDCPNAKVRDLLPGYAHGRLSGNERAEVESHLASCEVCTAELALIRTAARALGRAPAVDVDRIARAVREAAHDDRVGRARSAAPASARRTIGWRQAAAIAAVAVGAISLSLARPWNRGDVTRPGGDSVRVVAGTGAAGDGRTDDSAPGRTSAAKGATRTPEPPTSRAAGLTMAGGVGDLSDAALLALLGEIDSLDEAPSTEPAELLPALIDDEEGQIR